MVGCLLGSEGLRRPPFLYFLSGFSLTSSDLIVERIYGALSSRWIGPWVIWVVVLAKGLGLILPASTLTDTWDHEKVSVGGVGTAYYSSDECSENGATSTWAQLTLMVRDCSIQAIRGWLNPTAIGTRLVWFGRERLPTMAFYMILSLFTKRCCFGHRHVLLIC